MTGLMMAYTLWCHSCADLSRLVAGTGAEAAPWVDKGTATVEPQDRSETRGSQPTPLGRRFLRREPAAEAEVRALVGRVVAFGRYGVPRADRDDLVQEVLLQLWQAVTRPGFDFKRSFENFARVVAARRCIDWFRTRRQTTELNPNLPDRRDGPLSRYGRKQRVELVRQALARLRDSCRQLIRMHVREQLSYSEISARVGKSDGALRFQMYRCIQQAREILEQITAAREGGAGGTEKR